MNVLSPLTIGKSFDASRVGKTHDQTIKRLMQAVSVCGGNAKKQAALIQRLEHVVTLKVDVALVRAALEWNSPSLSALALFVYGLDVVTGENEKKSFLDAIEKLAPEAIREVMAKEPFERLLLIMRSGIVFLRALEISGDQADES
jgi:hypothetical protein